MNRLTRQSAPRKLGKLIIIFPFVCALLFFSHYFDLPALLKLKLAPAGTLTDCTGNGVTRSADGIYHFSWLHVNRGYIVDSHNCVVYLSGFNTAGTEFGDGIGGMSARRIALMVHQFRMNLWRLNINVTWWNQDAFVPKAGEHYRAWIQQLVSWMKASGDYVELTRTNQYPDNLYPPCGGGIMLCPSQAAGSGTNPWRNNPHFLASTTAFWKSITPLYKDDPAIVYDVWNEMPGVKDITLWRNAEETLIATVRAIAPQSLIFFGGPWWSNEINALTAGKIPDFSEQNLVYDFHVYPQSAWYSNWPTLARSQTTFAQAHNHAVDIGEFGTLTNFTPYLDNMITFAIEHKLALTLYEQANVVTKDGQITPEGQIIQAGYSRLRSFRQPRRALW